MLLSVYHTPLMSTLHLVPRGKWEVGPLSGMRRDKCHQDLTKGFLDRVLFLPQGGEVGPPSGMTAVKFYNKGLLDYFVLLYFFKALQGWEVGPSFGTRRSTLTLPSRRAISEMWRDRGPLLGCAHPSWDVVGSRRRAPRSTLTMDTISYSSVISACEEGRLWKNATVLFLEMWRYQSFNTTTTGTTSYRLAPCWVTIAPMTLEG